MRAGVIPRTNFKVPANPRHVMTSRSKDQISDGCWQVLRMPYRLGTSGRPRREQKFERWRSLERRGFGGSVCHQRGPARTSLSCLAVVHASLRTAATIYITCDRYKKAPRVHEPGSCLQLRAGRQALVPLGRPRSDHAVTLSIAALPSIRCVTRRRTCGCVPTF